jgi:hypothetical protein
MTDNYWEQTVYAAPPLARLAHSDMSLTFAWLRIHFPMAGSKIDWSRVRGHHVHRRFSDDAELAAVAGREVSQRVNDGSIVEHVGDALSPYGICFSGDDAPSIVAALLEIPEHHYFLAKDRSWVMVATSEGDLDVADQLSFD